MSVLYEKVFPVCYIPFKTFLKILACIAFVVLILGPCVYFFELRSPSKLAENYNSTRSEKSEVKTILYWTGKLENDAFLNFGEGESPFQDCRISACRATRNRNLMKIEDFDAILFHGIETEAHDLPSHRSYRQKYVFFDPGSPAKRPIDSAYLPDGFYNWTMTYSRNSDVPRAHGYFIDTLTNDVVYPLWARDNKAKDHTVSEKDLQSFAGDDRKLEGKRIAAASFVSNCHTDGVTISDRYIDELQKYVDVDVYGKCAPLSCKMGNEKYQQMLERRYYFYIAFENSFCQDYVTEKLYEAMSRDIVPIVYGNVNYSQFAPPGSYLNVVDFEGPEHLAKHLNHLMNTPEEYRKFFWWKSHFSIDFSHRLTFCKICEMLHDQDRLAPSTILDLKKWWSQNTCKDQFQLLKNTIQL